MGLVQNILSYYLVETDNNGVRVSCYVFSVIVWICMIPATIYNITVLKNIILSDASKIKTLIYAIFVYYSKCLLLAR